MTKLIFPTAIGAPACWVVFLVVMLQPLGTERLALVVRAVPVEETNTHPGDEDPVETLEEAAVLRGGPSLRPLRRLAPRRRAARPRPREASQPAPIPPGGGHTLPNGARAPLLI